MFFMAVVTESFGRTKRRCCKRTPIAISINASPTTKNPLWMVLYCATSANPIAHTISPVLVNVSCTPVISALCLASTSWPINQSMIGRVSDSPAAIISERTSIPTKL